VKAKVALVQALLAPKLHRWVKATAVREGISVGGWIRKLIEEARECRDPDSLQTRVTELERRTAALQARLDLGALDWRA